MRTYPGRQLIHDAQFDRDCERVFGSLEIADNELAQFMFEIGHAIAVGTAIASWVTVFVVPGTRPCLVVVETIDDHLLLRTLVASAGMQLAA